MEKNSTEILEGGTSSHPEDGGCDVDLGGALAGQGHELATQSLNDLIEFMRTYADRCHHGKEETYLFPALERSGVPLTGCPVGALRHEHQAGRALVGQLAQAVAAYSPERSCDTTTH